MKGGKKAIKYAEDRGFQFERANSKGFHYYRHPSGVEVGINPSCDERGLRLVMQQVDRACGVGPDLSQKRNPAACKAREAQQREALKAERARHAARLDELAREKAALLLGGAGRDLNWREVRAIEALIEAERKHHQGMVRLMTAVAGGAE